MSKYSKTDEHGQEKIVCNECGYYFHRLDVHLASAHKTTSKAYQAKYPGALTISPSASAKAGSAAKGATRKAKTPAGFTPIPVYGPGTVDNAAAPETTETATPETAETINASSATTGIYKIGVATLRHRIGLTETDVLYIPKHDPNWTFDEKVLNDWEAIAIGIEDNEPVYIAGPTGCGKSAGILEMAAIIGQPVLRVQLTRDFKVSQFVGSTELKLDEDGNRFTAFTKGVLPQAMANGWWLLLDEVDQAHPDVSMALQSVLEGNPLILSENFGEIVRPHENFRLIATANTLGRGDETGLYAGAKTGNEATLDRFGVTIKADYPTAKTEANILVARSGIPRDIATKMVRVAHNVRESLAAQNCNCTFSTRRLIAWAKKAVRMNDVRKSAQIAVLNKLDVEDAKFVDSLIQRYFGGEVGSV